MPVAKFLRLELSEAVYTAAACGCLRRSIGAIAAHLMAFSAAGPNELLPTFAACDLFLVITDDTTDATRIMYVPATLLGEQPAAVGADEILRARFDSPASGFSTIALMLNTR